MPREPFLTRHALEPLSGLHVEQMDERGARIEVERVARLEIVALAKQRDELALAEAQENQCLRAGRLDDGDAGLEAIRRKCDVFGANAVDHLLALADLVASGEGQQDTADLDAGLLAEPYLALEHVHRRRADEARHEQVR